jgi:hypothetical protein
MSDSAALAASLAVEQAGLVHDASVAWADVLQCYDDAYVAHMVMASRDPQVGRGRAVGWAVGTREFYSTLLRREFVRPS